MSLSLQPHANQRQKDGEPNSCCHTVDIGHHPGAIRFMVMVRRHHGTRLEGHLGTQARWLASNNTLQCTALRLQAVGCGHIGRRQMRRLRPLTLLIKDLSRLAFFYLDAQVLIVPTIVQARLYPSDVRASHCEMEARAARVSAKHLRLMATGAGCAPGRVRDLMN
jgi:hypothetical protein